MSVLSKESDGDYNQDVKTKNYNANFENMLQDGRRGNKIYTRKIQKNKTSKYRKGLKKIYKVVPHGKKVQFMKLKIKAKNHIIHDISSNVIQVEPQISSTLMRNSLRLHFLEVAEVGSQSVKKYEHLDLALQRFM
ncbi:hypothetical protein CFP56_036945 [Quercus suber]|uniref:Uncharacterized protein n=1 Tax=Quercus suber TaxID=58331 RepID=A0AAW0J641_QUESU